VWEWCAAVGNDAGSDRVVRGGSWISSAGICRSALRSVRGPSLRGLDLGFRLVLSPSGQETGAPGQPPSGAGDGSPDWAAVAPMGGAGSIRIRRTRYAA